MDPAQSIQPGDFILTTIDSWWQSLGVRIGQALSGKWSQFSHAAIYVGGPDRLVIEMAPGGLAVRPLTDFAGRELAISSWPLDLDERDAIVGEAWVDYKRLDPIRYGWLNYPLIGWFRLAGKRTRGWWITEKAERYLASWRYQICSQWVDNLYRRAEVHLFADGRLAGLVAPGDLTYVLSQPKST